MSKVLKQILYIYNIRIYTYTEERNKHDINPWETWSIHHKWHKLMPKKYISIQIFVKPRLMFLRQNTHISSNGRYVYLDFLNWRWIILLIMNRTASCTSISSLQHHGHLWTPMMYQWRSLVVVYTPRHSLRHRHNAEHSIRPQAHFFWFQVCISNQPTYYIFHLLIRNLLRIYENTKLLLLMCAYYTIIIIPIWTPMMCISNFILQ